MDCKIRTGYRVYGTTSLGEKHLWCYGNLESAMDFARHLAQQGQEVDILKYVGSVRPKELPTEFIQAPDWNEEPDTDSETLTNP